jgi:two-component system C4-dicarboxylate transport sensor histidine kinase DctB
MRFLPNILSILATLVIATATFNVSYSYFMSGELAKAEGRLSLYRSTVNTEFDRFSHLTFVLARDPFVIRTSLGGETEDLNARLEAFADRAGLEAIYLMDAAGLTIAASNHRKPGSFIGQNYAFRPYFQQALDGRQGRFYAIGTTTGLPGYFITDAVRDSAGAIQGVIAIKIGVSQLEDSWRASGEQVLLSNEDDVVLLASDPAWRYHVLSEMTKARRAGISASRQFPGQNLEPLDWQPLPDQRAEINGTERVYLSAKTRPHGWEIHYFASDDRAIARSWLVTSVVVLLAGLGLIYVQRQRTQRVAAALRRSEEEEAKLRKANERLAIEINERNMAERLLQRTERELERASRLAALGKLSASVTHELGQPIAAMRNHLAAFELSAHSSGQLPAKIGGLVDRMEGITRQLKFFARSESETFRDVDLCDAMRAAISLVEPNMAGLDIRLHTEIPEYPVLVRGSSLRIEQVMTNLLRNAVDAVEETDMPAIEVKIARTNDLARFEISDNGHGLGGATLSDLQEPFVTTRESGRGMGLGLAISASIVKDHGGTIKARNKDSGGAVFEVAFPFAETE